MDAQLNVVVRNTDPHDLDGTEDELGYHVGTWVVESRPPLDNRKYKLDELQEIVGGYIQIVSASDGRIIVLNEEGKLIGLPINPIATQLFFPGQDVIVGNVLICQSNMID